VTTSHNLSSVYFGQKKFAEAEPLFVEVLKQRRLKFGDNSGATQNVINSLAGTYVFQGKHAEAEPLLREMLAYRKAKEDSESPGVADALSKLGNCLLKLEKYAEAETHLRDCHAIRVSKQPNAWNVFNTQAQIGAALMGQKKYADAEPLMLQGYEGMKKRAAQIPPGSRIYVAEAIDRLVQLYDAWGQKDKAAQWRKIAEAGNKTLP
jgi:tetratricopeptide (TPR) repeat protein